MIPTKGYAVQDAKSDLASWNFERRQVGPNDVQFDIQYCGVCHSDLHQIKDDWGGSIFPMVPGHEIVGKVVKVGSHVKKFKIGDLAGTGCLVDSCRSCENCEDGLEQFCLNGFSPTYNGLEQDKKTPTLDCPQKVRHYFEAFFIDYKLYNFYISLLFYHSTYSYIWLKINCL